MKAIYYISLFVLLCAISVEAFSQQRTRQRALDVPADNTPVLTERAKIKNQQESKVPSHVAWLREMYRYIDLEKEANAPLLYPTEPIGDRKNLFSLLFRLVLDGKVNAYNYLDSREIFNETEKISIEDLLKKQQILYTTQGTETNIKYVVEDMDIPSSEVLLYMVKEAWYFDQVTADFKAQVIAICPILTRMDYYTGVVNKEALFWVTYDEIRPYISREMIMTSNHNNVLQYTIDDYFTKQMYNGEIVKTVNLMNQSLAQQVGDNPETLKLAQDSIENQLKAFDEKLWVYPDSTTLVEENVAGEESSKKTKTVARGNRNVQDKKEKVDKPKASKSESSSAPTKSVRRRR